MFIFKKSSLYSREVILYWMFFTIIIEISTIFIRHKKLKNNAKNRRILLISESESMEQLVKLISSYSDNIEKYEIKNDKKDLLSDIKNQLIKKSYDKIVFYINLGNNYLNISEIYHDIAEYLIDIELVINKYESFLANKMNDIDDLQIIRLNECPLVTKPFLSAILKQIFDYLVSFIFIILCLLY